MKRWIFVLPWLLTGMTGAAHALSFPMPGVGSDDDFSIADMLLNEAQDVYNATKIVCGNLSDEIAHVANISKANTAISGAGTAAATGALVTGIKKAATDEDIDAMIAKFCENADNCKYNGDGEQFYNKVITGLAAIAKDAEVTDVNGTDDVKDKIAQSKKLGNWRTGLMAGTVGTNLATAIISGRNMDQSELIQQVSACNEMMQKLSSYETALKSAGMNAMETPILAKIDKAKTWCNQIDTNDIEKIEKRMKASMGVSIAGGAIGVAGTATSAIANSNKYTNIENRVQLSNEDKQKSKNLNTAANIMSGANIATGATNTVLSISLITLANKLVKAAERCEEALK